MSIAPLVLLLVFVLIAVRRVGRFQLKIWQVMLGGAAAVLATGQISPLAALAAIDPDVMLFLFGMFVVGQALEESGWLAHVTYDLFRRARNVDQLLLLILFGVGFASAVLMNDTLAVIGTPLVLHLARQHRIDPKPLLLALAVAVTIGSVASPIGNPQNLLVAVNGPVVNPFVTFLRYLLVPTLLNLAAAFFILKFFFREHVHDRELDHTQEPVRDPGLARLVKISLGLIVLLIIAKTILSFCGLDREFRLTYIALAGVAPILIASPRRWPVLKHIDWHTLVFFAAMFVLMQGVWDSGFFQRLLTTWRMDITSLAMILTMSVVLSQFISNVPLVALYLPLLLITGIGQTELMALAAGSTIAGNLTILGAASNVIIIQGAEKRTGDTLTFGDFLKVGAPLTGVNVLVYWLFLR
jgi:Na+/H+ antiporter NhaD/arsenite permease-like protein